MLAARGISSEAVGISFEERDGKYKQLLGDRETILKEQYGGKTIRAAIGHGFSQKTLLP